MTDFNSPPHHDGLILGRPSDVTKFPIIDADVESGAREDYDARARREAAYLGENISLARDVSLLKSRAHWPKCWTPRIENDNGLLEFGCGTAIPLRDRRIWPKLWSRAKADDAGLAERSAGKR